MQVTSLKTNISTSPGSIYTETLAPSMLLQARAVAVFRAKNAKTMADIKAAYKSEACKRVELGVSGRLASDRGKHHQNNMATAQERGRLLNKYRVY